MIPRGIFLFLLFISFPVAAQDSGGPAAADSLTQDSLTQDSLVPDPYAAFDDLFKLHHQARWTASITSGFDLLLNSYSLATSDTTETLSEGYLSVGLEGSSARTGSHLWQLSGRVSAGTELFRENLEAQWKWRDDQSRTRVRLEADLRARQYRSETEYNLSSDNVDGDLSLRAQPWISQDHYLQFRGDARFMEFAAPSHLEVNFREMGGGVQLGSHLLAEIPWRLSYRLAERAYPDSSGIDRVTHGCEGDLEWRDDVGRSIHLYHKTGRRLIANENLKPNAWTHWTDLTARIPADGGDVFLDLQNEIWRYDHETEVYLNSWRADGEVGFRWGEPLAMNFRLGLTVERLDAGGSPETYTQVGFRGGLESFGSDVSGSIQLEYGRRHYTSPGSATPAIFGQGEDDGLDLAYSDFHYLEIWLMAGWSLSEDFHLDIMASYEPESHAEREDDSSLGYASVRLTWRPSL